MHRRNRRRYTAWAMLVALLWMQLAVAAYACPTMGGPGEQNLAATPHDCEHDGGRALPADPEHPNLCLQKSLAGSQHSETPQTAPIAPSFVLIDSVDRMDEYVAFAPRLLRLELDRLRSTTPPKSIAHCCFRI